MARLDLVFVINQRGFDAEFRMPDGIVGRELRKRGTRVERAAKRQVGVDTGHLRSLITTRVNRSGPTGEVEAQVGVFAEPGDGYATLHHDGTPPHLIEARPGKHLRFQRVGQVMYRERVMHPGTRPNRFLEDNLYLAVI